MVGSSSSHSLTSETSAVTRSWVLEKLCTPLPRGSSLCEGMEEGYCTQPYPCICKEAVSGFEPMTNKSPSIYVMLGRNYFLVTIWSLVSFSLRGSVRIVILLCVGQLYKAVLAVDFSSCASSISYFHIIKETAECWGLTQLTQIFSISNPSQCSSLNFYNTNIVHFNFMVNH